MAAISEENESGGGGAELERGAWRDHMAASGSEAVAWLAWSFFGV